ncbi:MAG: hypothetical protein HOA20_03635 [Rhodobacterales bacterium]|nr:hypothetical protein [Nitrosomonadaceae bacterium]MBT6894464.1 hypothetical protein [Rhodobacterales bacterium]
MKYILLSMLFSFFLTGAIARADSIAIVVHPDTKTSELSMSQLQKIFLADKQFWPDNTRITLLVRAPVAAEREVILDRIYHMSEDQFKQYWIAKMFRGEISTGPKLVFDAEMALDLAAMIPGSIAFIDNKNVNDQIKVLRIDGLLPTDDSYPLRSN